MFVLAKGKRIGSSAKFTIVNRDTESHQFELRFDPATCRWQFVAEVGDDNTDNQLYDLLNFLLDETPTWSGMATQLTAALTALDPTYSISPITLSRTLKSQSDFLWTRYGIVCNFTRNKDTRLVELSRDVIVVDCEAVTREPLCLPA